MKDMELKVVEVPLDSLVPYENNANIHSEQQISQIANSIQEFGFADPIGVWENEKGETEIVEGHGRILAAKKLGYDKVPVIYLNGLSDEQRRAYTHIHNQLTRNSQFDFDVLQEELDNLDFDWDSFGFEDYLPGEPVLDDGKNGADELSLEDFSKDEFQCECPRCGMRFNP